MTDVIVVVVGTRLPTKFSVRVAVSLVRPITPVMVPWLTRERSTVADVVVSGAVGPSVAEIRWHPVAEIELKLIDALGDEQAAIDWLAKTKNIDPKTPVRDYRLNPRFGDLPFLHVAMVGVLDAVGLGGLAERLRDWGTIQAVERLNLDGLLALWHPPSSN